MPSDDTLREPVRWFASKMEERLRANDDKDGWEMCSSKWLFARLLEEVEELRHALRAGESDAAIHEAADVANFAMMLADNARPAPPETGRDGK